MSETSNLFLNFTRWCNYTSVSEQRSFGRGTETPNIALLPVTDSEGNE